MRTIFILSLFIVGCDPHGKCKKTCSSLKREVIANGIPNTHYNKGYYETNDGCMCPIGLIK